jgi:DNA-binding NarL/FixJ family response regulator
MSAAIARRVLDMFAKTAPPPGRYGLTAREKDILQHVVDGLSPKMIAGALHLSLNTVTTHIKNIFAKLQVHSWGEVVAKALRENLI